MMLESQLSKYQMFSGIGAYSINQNKPKDIPANPPGVYKDKGWIGMKDWLGTKWRPFREAREFARKLGLESSSEWREYCKSSKKPDDIPPSPAQAYKKEWEDMANWLGAELRPFEEVRGFARKLGLKSKRNGQQSQKKRKLKKQKKQASVLTLKIC